MKNFFKEPLVHFLLLGAALFLLYSFLNKDEERPEDYTIHIAKSDVDRLSKAYQKNWNTPPDSSTLALLIEEEVHTEMLYREALRMNLDHNDEIIRRRLKQKYEFLVKDLVSLEQASDTDLQTFYETHPDLYQQAKTISFTHIYFSPDKRASPEVDALAVYQQVKDQTKPNNLKALGDSFHLPNYFANKDRADVRQPFGKQFAEALFAIETTGWTKPIPSGYGYHVVQINSIATAALMPFGQVQEKVMQDWQAQQQAVYNTRLSKNLLEQYKIEYDY